MVLVTSLILFVAPILPVYSLDNTWTQKTSLPENVWYESGLVWTGGDYIYGGTGWDTTGFYRYSISGNSWAAMSPCPDGEGDGQDLVWTGGDYIYFLPGPDNRAFWRYSISQNSWIELEPALDYPWHSALVYGGGDYIYALGLSTWEGEPHFLRYSISADSWDYRQVIPQVTQGGLSMAWTGGDYIYTLAGGQSSAFWRYSISADSWTAITSAPMGIWWAGSLAWDGSDYIYACGGWNGVDLTDDFWRYRISGDSWETLASAPFLIENGGLAYANGKIYTLRGSSAGIEENPEFWSYETPGPHRLPGAMLSTPALVCDGYETHMVVRGTDNGIYYMRTDYMGGGGWSGTWTQIPGKTCDEPALAIMGNDLHLVVRGMDNGLYHKIMNINTGVWGDWIPLGGSTTSAPTFITSTTNSLALVVRGSDDGIYYNSYIRVPLGGDLWLVMWTGWTSLGGATCDKPALASDGTTLTLAVRGMDNGIYVKAKDLSSGVWSEWLHFSGATPSPPAVEAEFTEDDFVLAVRGMDNMIYYTYTWHGEWSGPWFTVPGVTIDRPLLAKTSIPDEVLHLVVRGSDNGIYHTTDWSGWTWVAGNAVSCPGLTDYYYVGLELVYRDASNNIWYDFWSSGSGW